MTVITPEGTAEWSVVVETISAHHSYRLTLTAPDGASWSSEKGDVFECLLTLRDEIEPLGFRLCCNGARKDAWASGMLRDMGMGKSVYLLADARKGERPPQVGTLEAAPADMIVTVEEQRRWYADWLKQPAGTEPNRETPRPVTAVAVDETSDDQARLATGRAVLTGHGVITVPVVVLIAAVSFAVIGLTNLNWRLAVVVGICVGWLWWSCSVPRWRRWALRHGADPLELQRLAQRTGLVWPEGSFMSRTEIPPRR